MTGKLSWPCITVNYEKIVDVQILMQNAKVLSQGKWLCLSCKIYLLKSVVHSNARVKKYHIGPC